MQGYKAKVFYLKFCGTFYFDIEEREEIFRRATCSILNILPYIARSKRKLADFQIQVLEN